MRALQSLKRHMDTGLITHLINVGPVPFSAPDSHVCTGWKIPFWIAVVSSLFHVAAPWYVSFFHCSVTLQWNDGVTGQPKSGALFILWCICNTFYSLYALSWVRGLCFL